MSIEHHHHHVRRIHRKARAIHLGLAPLTVLVVPAWIYFAYAWCEEGGGETACRLLRALPFVPILIAVGFLAWILRDLASVGVDERALTHGKHPGRRRLEHARHGWSLLGHDHRRHVRWAAVQVVAVTAALLLWLCWTAYRTTR